MIEFKITRNEGDDPLVHNLDGDIFAVNEKCALRGTFARVGNGTFLVICRIAKEGKTPEADPAMKIIKYFDTLQDAKNHILAMTDKHRRIYNVV